MSKEDIEIQKLKDDLINSCKRQDEIVATLNTLNAKLEPIATAFNTTKTLGKWIMAFMVFISILLGILLSWSKLNNL